MVQAPMLDGSVEHDRLAFIDMGIAYCMFGTYQDRTRPVSTWTKPEAA